MKKRMVYLGITCLIAALLQCFVLKGFGSFVPYLAFCACAFILCKGSLKVSNVFKFILIGAIALPIFDFMLSTVTAPFASGLIVMILVLLVQALVYYFALVATVSWVNEKKFAVRVQNHLMTGAVALIYSALSGIYNAALINAVAQGNMYSWLSAFGNNLFSIAATLVFYVGVFCAAMQTDKE